ncbi:unnamed protein product [Staurois parvus]|uniref:Uncharacterized protein n=1 Tax=Staurois parvus TaxID=386267 RepID=A0ABN9FBM5_9NEOB|nr:unnamed protein product [Staurois parvus]
MFIATGSTDHVIRIYYLGPEENPRRLLSWRATRIKSSRFSSVTTAIDCALSAGAGTARRGSGSTSSRNGR